MNLDLSKASGPDCIPVVVLKNCEPELSYILAELFSKCLKESCFPDYWKVSSVVPVFLEGGLLIILIDFMIFLSPFLDVTRMSMSTVSFLAQLGSGILCL